MLALLVCALFMSFMCMDVERFQDFLTRFPQMLFFCQENKTIVCVKRKILLWFFLFFFYFSLPFFWPASGEGGCVLCENLKKMFFYSKQFNLFFCNCCNKIILPNFKFHFNLIFICMKAKFKITLFYDLQEKLLEAKLCAGEYWI